MSYAKCPKCFKQCWMDADGNEPNLVEIKNKRHTNTAYGPGENWVEVWKCPDCSTVFEEPNGYP